MIFGGNMFGVMLLSYRGTPFNMFVYDTGVGIYRTNNKDNAEKVKEKWAKRNPDSIYYVAEIPLEKLPRSKGNF